MSSGQNQVRRIVEVTPGTTPAGAMTTCPWTEFSHSAPLEREEPGDVVADRQPTDNPATNISVSATGSCDAGYQNHDIELAAVFSRAKTAAATVTNTGISAVASTNTLHGATSIFGSFLAGDIVWVTGLTTNGTAFLAVLSAATADDLTLDLDSKTLVDETAGASVTVRHSGLFACGTSLLTATYEIWNTATSVGYSLPYLGATEYTFNLQHPNKCTESFAFMGGVAPTRLSAQLANATTVGATNGVLNSNIHFGDALNPNAGLGLKWGGTALTLRVKTLKLMLRNPKSADGGAGVLGPQDLAADNRFGATIEIKCPRTGSSGIEDLIDDCNDANTVESLGFGFRDGAGNRRYFWAPECQPGNGQVTGVKQSGRDEFTFTLSLRKSATYGLLRIGDINA